MIKTVAKKGTPSPLDKYRGKWVAVTEDETVIASGYNLEDILPFIKDKKTKPKAYALFIPKKRGRIQI